jgi:protein transport protein SEC24
MGLPGENGNIVFPPRLSLSSEKLNRGSIFLLEDGLDMFLWIGRHTPPDVLMAFFGQPNLEIIPLGKVMIV